MSKIFLNTIIQYGGELSNSEKNTLLNTIIKHTNKKIKIIEYKYGIQIKLNPLPINTWNLMPKNVVVNSVAKVNTNIKGNIPIYTNATINLQVPTISQVTAGIPLTPFGPVIQTPAIQINPFGNTFDDLVNKVTKYLEILKLIQTQLEQLKNGFIEKKDIDTRYFEFVDLEPDLIDNLIDEKSGYSSL
jgi:hypothetical protein